MEMNQVTTFSPSKNTMKIVVYSALSAIVTSVVVQQISYRNSLEFKVKETLSAMQSEQVRQANEQCQEYTRLKAGNPTWEPVGDYYDHCK